MKAAPRAGSLNIGERSVPRPSNSPSGSRPTSDTSVGKMSTSLPNKEQHRQREPSPSVSSESSCERSRRVRQASSEAYVLMRAMAGGGGEASLGEDVCLLPNGCGEPRAGDHEGNACRQLVVGLLLPLVVPADANARHGSAAGSNSADQQWCWVLRAVMTEKVRAHSPSW